MSDSYSLDSLADDPTKLAEDLATHPEGIMAILRGNDVARIVPLSAEEIAWRQALRRDGQDPDSAKLGDPHRHEFLPIHAEVERRIYGDRSPAPTENRVDEHLHEDVLATTEPESDREVDVAVASDPKPDEDREVELDWDEYWTDPQAN